jgi:hypothetical protein
LVIFLILFLFFPPTVPVGSVSPPVALIVRLWNAVHVITADEEGPTK